MKEGVIVNIGSSVGIAADPAAPAYSASKAWVIHFTKCIAQQYGKTLRCNTVSPGPVDTPFLWNAFGNNPAAMEEIKKYNPAGRIATPEEIAETILHVIRNKNFNGANVATDGGESVFYYEPPKPV